MFVISPSPYESTAFYPPSILNPWSGICDGAKYNFAFTVPYNSVPAVKGITLCPFYFKFLSFRDLGEPQPSHLQDVNMAMIATYGHTSGVTLLHELTHLGTGNGKSINYKFVSDLRGMLT